jgi:hypothetical protein
MKIRPVETKLLNMDIETDRKTGRRDEANSDFSQLFEGV